MKRYLTLVATLLCLGVPAFAVDTATPTATPSSTPTYTPAKTPFAYSSKANYPVCQFTSGTTGSLIGTENPGNACLCYVALEPTSSGTEVTMQDGNSNVIFGAKFDNLDLELGTLGPCVAVPVSVGGTGRVSVGWYNRGSE